MQTSEQEDTAVKQYPSVPHFNQIHRHGLHFNTDPSKHRSLLSDSVFFPIPAFVIQHRSDPDLPCWPHKPCAKILQWVTITVMGNAGAGTLEQFWPEGTTASPTSPSHHRGQGHTCRWHLQTLLTHSRGCWFRLKPANQTTVLRGAAASGSSQLGLQLSVSSKSEVPSTGSPYAGTGEPENAHTHVEKPRLQLWLRQI